jgi:predicted RNase H-like nuclease (RuvC/YqgF family)
VGPEAKALGEGDAADIGQEEGGIGGAIGAAVERRSLRRREPEAEISWTYCGLDKPGVHSRGNFEVVMGYTSMVEDIQERLIADIRDYHRWSPAVNSSASSSGRVEPSAEALEKIVERLVSQVRVQFEPFLGLLDLATDPSFCLAEKNRDLLKRLEQEVDLKKEMEAKNEQLRGELSKHKKQIDELKETLKETLKKYEKIEGELLIQKTLSGVSLMGRR